MKSSIKLLLGISLLSFILYSCDNSAKKNKSSSEETTPSTIENVDLNNKGIGPIKDLDLEPIDEVLVAEGKTLFDTKCMACHNFSSRLIGPALNGLMEKRSPEWIMNMMLNPQEMIEKDPIAISLYEEFKTIMISSNLTESEARSILEYLRDK